MMGEHEHSARRLGDVSCATPQRGRPERIDPLDERRSPYQRGELVEHPRGEGVKGVGQESVGPCQPAVAFSVLSALVLRPQWRASMLVVPGQHEASPRRVWPHPTACRSEGCSVCDRHHHGIEMRANGLQRVGERGALELCEHGKPQRECRTPPCRGAPCAMRRAEGAGGPPPGKQPVQWVGARARLLPGTRRGVIWWQPLVKMARAAGLGQPLGCLVCRVEGGLGGTLPARPHLAEVATRVAIMRPPPGHVRGELGARPDALAAL
jgi:hypothetical protein